MTDITSKYLITEVHFEVVTDGTHTNLVQFTHVQGRIQVGLLGLLKPIKILQLSFVISIFTLTVYDNRYIILCKSSYGKFQCKSISI